MNRIHRRYLQRRGFTLVEVMVAIAVLAILCGLTYASMAYSLEAQDRSRRLHDRYHAARLTMERLKKELGMAFISLHQSEDKRTKTVFEGDRSRLLFVSSSHEPIQRDARQSDQVELEYFLTRKDGEEVLMRRIKHRLDDRPGKGGREEVMVSGVKDLRFEYYDPDQVRWRSDWTVRVEDAEEMRVKLKAVRAQGDQVKDALEGRGDVVETLGEGVVDKKVEDAETELLDELFLPSRVRIRLVLVDDEDREYTLETQAEVPMRDPLWY